LTGAALLLFAWLHQSHAATVDYTLRITDPASHFAHVRMVCGGMAEVSSFTLYSHSFETTNIYFENYSLTTGDGDQATYQYRQESGSFEEEILQVDNSAGADQFILEYDVHYLSTFNNNLETLHAGILADRAIFDMQHLMFNFHGATVPFDASQTTTTITFDIPDNWVMATSWEGTGRTYAGTHNYIFMPTPSCGDYTLEKFELGGVAVRLGIPNGAVASMPVSVAELTQMAKDGFTQMLAVYGKPSESKAALDDLVALIGSYKPMATQESGHGTAYFNVDESPEGLQYSLAYALGEILRLWYGDEPETYWVRQTFWEYELGLNRRRLGYMTTSELNDQINQWLGTYQAQVVGTKYDAPIPELMNYLYYNNQDSLSEEDRAGYQTAMNAKGSLFWVCINGMIKEHTSQAKDVFDFSAAMNKKYDDGYTIDDIVCELNNLTGWEFTSFFADHYYGNEALQPEPYLAQ